MSDTDLDKKRKRSELSSVSDIDNKSPVTGKEKKKKKKKATQSETIEEGESTATNMEDIKEELKSMNVALSKVLKKDDPYLETLIKKTFNSMKEDFLQSVSKRIDILEHSLFEKQKENDMLKEKVSELDKKLNESDTENDKLRREIENIETKMQEQMNNQEQYSRRNNIRISGVAEEANENSDTTAKTVIGILNKHMKEVKLKEEDIDIAHRLGKSKEGKRQIIVKFISRRNRNAVLRNKKSMKGTGIFINEDLTKVNQSALMCVKKKLPDEVERAWTYDGVVKYRNKMGNVHTLKFEEYQSWYDMPWP